MTSRLGVISWLVGRLDRFSGMTFSFLSFLSLEIGRQEPGEQLPGWARERFSSSVAGLAYFQFCVEIGTMPPQLGVIPWSGGGFGRFSGKTLLLSAILFVNLQPKAWRETFHEVASTFELVQSSGGYVSARWKPSKFYCVSAEFLDTLQYRYLLTLFVNAQRFCHERSVPLHQFDNFAKLLRFWWSGYGALLFALLRMSLLRPSLIEWPVKFAANVMTSWQTKACMYGGGLVSYLASRAIGGVADLFFLMAVVVHLSQFLHNASGI